MLPTVTVGVPVGDVLTTIFTGAGGFSTITGVVIVGASVMVGVTRRGTPRVVLIVGIVITQTGMR